MLDKIKIICITIFRNNITVIRHVIIYCYNAMWI